MVALTREPLEQGLAFTVGTGVAMLALRVSAVAVLREGERSPYIASAYPLLRGRRKVAV